MSSEHLPEEADRGTAREPPEESIEAWVENTSGLDRVISVALSLDRGRTASWIADQAHVAKSTARAHLERLVDLQIVGANTASDTTTYSLNMDYQRFREVSDLKRKFDRQELEERIIAIKEKIEEWQSEFGVESPQELRARASDEETSAEEARECLEIASKWETHLHEQEITRAALRNYDE